MRTERRPTRSPRLVVLAVVALAAIVAGLAPSGWISGRQESFPLEIGATRCQRAPDTLAPQAVAAAGCEPAPAPRTDGAIDALAPGAATPPGAAPDATGAPGSWLDDAQAAWNAPGLPIPAAPAPLPSPSPRCQGRARPAETAEDAAVVAQGWQLYGAYERGWGITLVGGFLDFDAMCRPVPYQQFVFVDGVFAGTLAPRPMLPRTDGALAYSGISAADRLYGVYLRYAPTDPLCCPSGEDVAVEFAVARTPEGPVVNPVLGLGATATPAPADATTTDAPAPG